MTVHHAVIALGSNLGDREATIRDAMRDLAAHPDIVVTKRSSLVETPALKPDGVDADAPAYLNAVVAVRTGFAPRELLVALNGIERAHGRVRDVRWGDRTLDLDIVSFDDLTLDEPDLTIPHPRAADRAFVLAPWLEIEPEAIIPGRGTVADLLAATGETPVPFEESRL